MEKGSSDSSFLLAGFKNWKDGTVAFKDHQSSVTHKKALQLVVDIPSSNADVGEMLSSEYAQEERINKQCLLKILSNVAFLARQGLAFRGDGDEVNSNFIQLLQLRGLDDPRINDWVSKKTNKYTSHHIQDELLTAMALNLLQKIAVNLTDARFFCIMCDECTDAANREQLVVCIRWVDYDLEAHEELIGFYKLDNIEANTIVSAIKDVLQRLNLPMSKCRGQCYDGASTMKGPRSGVAKQLLDEEPRAIYTHCYGNLLNLAIGDTVKGCKIKKDSLDLIFEVSKLVKFSPKRDVHFEKLKNELAPDSPGFRVLCPTRWTVRAASFKSVIDNYVVLQKLWEESIDQVTDPSIKARIIGVKSQFKTFRLYFGIQLGHLLLQHSDNLSKTLQSDSLYAATGQKIAAMTVTTLKSVRNDESFDLFWQKIEKARQSLDVGEPILPRKRKVPKRFEDGSAQPEFFDDPKPFYRQQFYEALDLVITGINERFDQPGYKMYENLENLLIKAVKQESYEECLTAITEFYTTDFDAAQLKLHLDILASNFPVTLRRAATVMDVRKHIQVMSSIEKLLISQVLTLLHLILVMSATNASSERSFSAMRRVKTYLCSTMSQDRLNHIILLHCHKDFTDSLDLVAVANEFVDLSNHRLGIFG